MHEHEPQEEVLSFHRLFNGPLTILKAIIIITIVGFVIFGNALFNGFALDDTSQILSNIPAHSIQNITTFFQGSTFGPDVTGSGKLVGDYYKPLMTTVFALIYTIFGANAFFFHFFQLLLHITNSILVFYLLIRFFPRKLGLFLSLLFLIHPLNVETVANIASFQDVLFFFFGMIALILCIKSSETKTPHTLRTNILIFLLLLCSLLSKETGILFIIILPVFSWLFLKKITRWTIFIPLASLVVYFFLRFFVGHVYFSTDNISPIATFPLWQRLLNIPGIIFYYVQNFFLPNHLITGQTWVIKSITFSQFYFPLLFDLLFFAGVFFIGWYIYIKQKTLFENYLFFLIWFCVGLFFHLQIFPLDSTVADRWFYFPMIGLLGILGLGIHILLKKKNSPVILAVVGITVLVLFSLRNIVRNTDWYSTYTIVSHDILFEEDDSALQNALASEYQNMGNTGEALKHYQIAYSLEPESAIFSNIALLYAMQGDFKTAENDYEKLLVIDPHYYPTYINLSHAQLKSNDPHAALTTAKKGLVLYPKSDQLWTFLAFAEYKLGNTSAALADINKAYTLSKNNIYLEYKNTISQNESIDGYL